MSKVFRNGWMQSILINLIVLICFLICTDLVYETNDDYVISMRMVDGYPYNTFINFFLCKIVIALQSMIPSINAFVLMQIILSWACFVCITKVFIDSGKSKWFIIIAILVLTVFAGDHYSIIQFTKTSALVLTTGMLLLIDALIKKRGIGYYIGAFVFVYFGIWLRDMNFFVALGFAGLYLITWVIINRKTLVSGEYLTGKRIAVYILCLAVLGGAVGSFALSTNINKSSKELLDFYEYDIYRTYITDYPVYEDYTKAPNKYSKIGLSENDMYLSSNWYLDYDGAASIDNLKAINNIYEASQESNKSYVKSFKTFIKEALSDIREFNRRGMHFVLIGIVALLCMLMYKPKYWMYVFGIGIAAAVIYTYLFYVGRPLYRAGYIVDLSVIIWLLYYADIILLRESIQVNKLKRVKLVTCIVAIIILLGCQIPIYEKHCELNAYSKAGQMSEEMADYLDDNQNDFFVFGSGTRGKSPYYSNPIRISEKGYQKNAIGFGSWGTKSPYISDKFEKYGLDNVFKDLIDNEHVYVFEDKNVARLEEYFNKWYGDSNTIISMDCVKSIEGHSMYRILSNDYSIN